MKRGIILGFSRTAMTAGIGYLNIKSENGDVKEIQCALATTLRQLAKAFGDDPDGPNYLDQEIYYSLDDYVSGRFYTCV